MPSCPSGWRAARRWSPPWLRAPPRSASCGTVRAISLAARAPPPGRTGRCCAACSSTASSSSAGTTGGPGRWPVLGRIEALRRHKECPGVRLADLAEDEGRDDGGRDAQTRLGKAKAATFGGDGDVADGGKAGATTQRRAVHAPDHRETAVVDGAEHVGHPQRVGDDFRRGSKSRLARIQVRSAPAQKLGPSPRSTTARTRSSLLSRVKASLSSAISRALKALCTSGRFSVTYAVMPRRSTRRCSYCLGAGRVASPLVIGHDGHLLVPDARLPCRSRAGHTAPDLLRTMGLKLVLRIVVVEPFAALEKSHYSVGKRRRDHLVEHLDGPLPR